jgi:hypothetical protein
MRCTTCTFNDEGTVLSTCDEARRLGQALDRANREDFEEYHQTGRFGNKHQAANAAAAAYREHLTGDPKGFVRFGRGV